MSSDGIGDLALAFTAPAGLNVGMESITSGSDDLQGSSRTNAVDISIAKVDKPCLGFATFGGQLFLKAPARARRRSARGIRDPASAEKTLPPQLSQVP